VSENLSFEVMSTSTGEIYHVSVVRNGANLTCTCTCPAGQKGTACKHRLGILSGSSSGVTGGDINRIESIPGLTQGTDVETALINVSALEEQIAALKNQLKTAKKALGGVLDD
jgi:uncharacterized Zn finger protein